MLICRNAVNADLKASSACKNYKFNAQIIQSWMSSKIFPFALSEHDVSVQDLLAHGRIKHFRKTNICHITMLQYKDIFKYKCPQTVKKCKELVRNPHIFIL